MLKELPFTCSSNSICNNPYISHVTKLREKIFQLFLSGLDKYENIQNIIIHSGLANDKGVFKFFLFSNKRVRSRTLSIEFLNLFLR